MLPFAPSVSTVGVLATSLDVLTRAMRVLLRGQGASPPRVANVYLLEEAFALADPAVRQALAGHVAQLRSRPDLSVTSVTLRDVTGLDLSLVACNEQALRVLQTAEVANTIGGWIQANRPQLGPNFQAGFRNVERFERGTMSRALDLCEALFARVNAYIRPGDVFCYPTAPVLVPRKGTLTPDNLPAVLDYYDRTMAATSFAGVARLPEITLPVARAGEVPVGLSLAAAHYQDGFLLDACRQLWGPDLGAQLR